MVRSTKSKRYWVLSNYKNLFKNDQNLGKTEYLLEITLNSELLNWVTWRKISIRIKFSYSRSIREQMVIIREATYYIKSR